MASKSKSLTRKGAGFGVKNLAPELQRAEALMRKKKWLEASLVLNDLNRTYPNNPDILLHLVNACYELKDFPSYEHACEMLVKADPKNADVAYSLAGGHYANMHPVLALQAFQNAVNRFPKHEKAKDARGMIAELEKEVDGFLASINLTRTDGWEIAVLHERAQVYMSRGEFEKAKQAEQELLRLRPDFVSSYNNLSLISFTEGNLEQALAYSQKVLEIKPDNIHALANLTRYSLLQGDIKQAEGFCEKLQNSEAEGWDIWTKKAEALSFFGLDEAILQLYEQVKAKEEEIKYAFLTGYFPHFVAVALARQGKIDEARKLWREALKQTKASALAQQNLDDLKKPIGERHAPWSLTLSSWITKTTLEELLELPFNSKSKDEQQTAKTIKRFFDQHPYFNNLVPMLLDRGDPQGREFAFRLANFAKTPELLAVLRDFALSQRGFDRMRYESAIAASEAGLLPKSNVELWIQGKWQKVNLFSYELHSEPTATHSPKVKQLAAQAVSLMQGDDVKKAQTAEEILKKAIEIEPTPDLLNNLAGAYQIQGRTPEAYAQLEEICEKFPDYVFAPVSLARLKITLRENRRSRGYAQTIDAA